MTLPVVKLEEIAEVRLGRQRSPKNHVGTHMRPYLRAANVGWDGLKLDDVKQMNFTDAEMATHSLRPGDLLLTEASGSPGEVGKPALWSGELDECAFQNTLIRVRPRGADSRYLLHFFRNQARTGAFAAGSRGVGIHHMGQAALAGWPVPLPSLDEQRRIAAILDQAEELRSKSAAAVDLSASAIESLFRQDFGGLSATATVENVAAHEKGSIRTGPFGSQLLHSEFTFEGIAVLGIDNVVTNEFGWRGRRYITPGKYEQLKRYTVAPGDVLITIMGTCGRCVVVPDDIPLAINTKHLCAITVGKRAVLPEFLRACFLWHPQARRHLASHTKGAVMDGLNMGIIKSMPLPLPPMNEQINFVERASKIREQTKISSQRAAQLDVIAEALRARAFSGKL